MHRRPLLAFAELLTRARRLVVIEDLVNHTNLGAIFRAAAALGMDGVVLSPESADPLYRRSVRVSMGAVFGVPVRPGAALAGGARGPAYLRVPAAGADSRSPTRWHSTSSGSTPPLR